MLLFLIEKKKILIIKQSIREMSREGSNGLVINPQLYFFSSKLNRERERERRGHGNEVQQLTEFNLGRYRNTT